MKEKGKYGSDLVKGLGTTEIGIPSYDKEPTVSVPPMESRFTKIHDVSMKEAMRMVGRGKKEKD